MYTPRQSLYIKGSAGDPLPVVFESLDQKGTRFLRGQLCLVCAGPGTGKSAFVLAYVLKSGVEALYFSADSDAFTQLTRSVAMLSECTTDQAAEAVREDNLGEAADELDNLPIRFIYDASPSLDRIEDVLRAWDEVYGDFPEMVVIDNITNLRSGSEDGDPFSGLEALMDYLHDLARTTSACTVGLHHVNGEYNDANKPIPLSGVKGQITRVPEMVLTMHRVSEQFGPDSLRISTVKNRGGKADPSGSDYAELEFIGDNMTIKDCGK